jgi:hypothetical protein
MTPARRTPGVIIVVRPVVGARSPTQPGALKMTVDAIIP